MMIDICGSDDGQNYNYGLLGCVVTRLDGYQHSGEICCCHHKVILRTEETVSQSFTMPLANTVHFSLQTAVTK
jgi:hypothetical protein